MGTPFLKFSRFCGMELDMANVMNNIKGFFSGIKTSCVDLWKKAVALFKDKTKNVKWKEVWDKFTTGLLIVLLASPVLILAYIILWFVFR